MDEVEDAEEVEETLPAALVAPALIGAAAERETVVAAVETPVLPRVDRNCRAFVVVGAVTVAVRTPVVRVGRVALSTTLTALTLSFSADTGSRWRVLVWAAERARDAGCKRVAVTALADVVGSGGVTLSVGLDGTPLRTAETGKGGIGGTAGTSEETLSFLLAPSSDTLRTMGEASTCAFENGGLDLSEASVAM